MPFNYVKELVRECSKGKLFQHPNGEIGGAGASRNLETEKAQCEYMSFIVTDDIMKPYFKGVLRVFGN